MSKLDEALSRLVASDRAAGRDADARQVKLTKPPGALGLLEPLGSQLSAIAGRCPPPVPSAPVVAVFAGDHGVLAEGVSPWPREVTAQMVANFLAGGAAINVLAREVGARVVVVDVGVATPVPAVPRSSPEGFVAANVRKGTANLVTEPAMSLDEARRAMEVGAELASRLVDGGIPAGGLATGDPAAGQLAAGEQKPADLLVTGDMGIGNTTPSAALIAALTGRSVREVTGRGTGISDEAFEKKVAAIERALRRVAESHRCGEAVSELDADVLLSELGGLEIAAIAGFVIGGASQRVPVVLDGVIALAGALVAARLAPLVVDYLVAGHRSVEPGAGAVLSHLGLVPLLDLGLRLGEGSGGCLAIPVIRSAARLLSEMATFADAGVAGSEGSGA